MKEPKNVDRNTLYEQVWTMPLIHLAKEYGISDVGLKKICIKMEILTPERGYWQRKRARIQGPEEGAPKTLQEWRK